MIEDWHDLRVTVMGLGVFGGGLGAAKWLLRQGARVTITDLKTEDKLHASVSALEGEPIRWRLGRHEWSDFTDADAVVVNPAVPKSSPYLRTAADAGCHLTSEMNLFIERCPSRIAAVTGSNGKSTTTQMVYEILRRKGRAWLGGNLGISLLNSLDNLSPDDWTVLELSSFQLEDLPRIRRGPDLAVVTHLTPNHLDRHGTMEEYTKAKMNIVRRMNRHGIAILNRSDPVTWEWRKKAKGTVWGFQLVPGEEFTGTFCEDDLLMFQQDGVQTPIMSLSDIPLPGEHNIDNALVAIGAGLAAGASREQVVEALSEFSGLPHRLELVTESEGVRYYNDSKATTPDAAIVALQSFEDKVILLAGGYDKQLPIEAFGKTIADRVKLAILMGDSAPAVRRSIRMSNRDAVDIQMVSDLRAGVAVAKSAAAEGDVVLLSPGFASYKMFNNYVERGELFRELVGVNNQ